MRATILVLGVLVLSAQVWATEDPAVTTPSTAPSTAPAPAPAPAPVVASGDAEALPPADDADTHWVKFKDDVRKDFDSTDQKLDEEQKRWEAERKNRAAAGKVSADDYDAKFKARDAQDDKDRTDAKKHADEWEKAHQAENKDSKKSARSNERSSDRGGYTEIGGSSSSSNNSSSSGSGGSTREGSSSNTSVGVKTTVIKLDGPQD